VSQVLTSGARVCTHVYAPPRGKFPRGPRRCVRRLSRRVIILSAHSCVPTNRLSFIISPKVTRARFRLSASIRTRLILLPHIIFNAHGRLALMSPAKSQMIRNKARMQAGNCAKVFAVSFRWRASLRCVVYGGKIIAGWYSATYPEGSSILQRLLYLKRRYVERDDFRMNKNCSSEGVTSRKLRWRKANEEAQKFWKGMRIKLYRCIDSERSIVSWESGTLHRGIVHHFGALNTTAIKHILHGRWRRWKESASKWNLVLSQLCQEYLSIILEVWRARG